MPTTDDWGGVAVEEPQKDDWGGIAVAEPKADAKTDDWGGVAVGDLLPTPPNGVTPQGMVDTTRQVLNAFTGPGSLAQGNQIFDDAQRKGVLADPEVQSFLNEKEASVGGDLKNLLQGSDPNALDKLQGEAGKFTNLDYAGKVNPQALVDFVKVHAVGPLQELRHPEEVKVHPPGQENNPVIQLPYPTGDTTGAGVGRSISKQVSGLTTPQNLAILAATAGAPAIVQKLVAVGFSATMAKDAAERVSDLVENHDKMSPGEFAEKTTDAVGMAALAALGIKHATGRPGEGGATPAERADSLTPEAADSAAVKNQLRTLQRGIDERGNLLPEKVYQGDAKSTDPEALQGIALSYAKRLEQLKNAPEAQKPAIQAELDSLDEQLQQFDRKDAYDALAKARLPGEEAPPSNVTKLPEQVTPAVPTEAPPTPAESAGPTPPETSPPGDVTTPAPAVETPEVAAYKRIQKMKDRIESETGDTLMADAFEKQASASVASALKNGKEIAWSNIEKWGRSAGLKERINAAESLDAPVGESEKTKLDTTPAPEAAPENKELLSAMDKAIGEALPARDAAILNGFKEGRKLDDIAAEHGVSPQRVSQIIKAALPKLKEALEKAGFTKDDYMGGPGAMGPVEAMEMKLREGETTGLKRAVVDTDRLARGAEPIPTVERQREDLVVRDAEDLAASDPTATPSLISRIVDKGDTKISERDAALLLVERARLMNERAAWEERVGDKDQVETARTRLTEIESELNRLDIAQRAAGSTWGRLGHMYQRMIRDDFTLEAMERKFRAAKQGPLTAGERAKIKAQSEQIAELQKQVDEGRTKLAEEQFSSETSRMLEATINELGKEFLRDSETGVRFDQRIVAAAERIVKGLENQASAALKRIRARRAEGRLNSLPVEDLVDYSIVGAAKIARKGLDFGKWSAEMVKDLGEMSADVLKQVWDASNTRLDDLGNKTGVNAEKVKRALRPKTVKTPVEAGATAKAEAVAGEGLSHKTAYETVEAVINSGIHGENAVFAEAHKILKESFPELTERDVRRAFTEYGKAKFPSKDATKVELAELRRLGQLQESIDRIKKDALDPLKSGLQRDKASLAVREKTKELNELLKKREGAPSEEKLASRDQAKQTALKNRIEELDKQLRTGEKPVKTGTAPDSVATEQLRAERDAMAAKLKEIQDAENPGMTPEERYNSTRLKAVRTRTAELEAKTKAGDFSRPAKPTPPAKTADLRDAEFKLNKTKQAFNNGVFNEKLKNRSALRKGLEGTRDVLNTARSIRTAFDLSAVLRQGGFIALSHPIRAAKAFPAMFKALASEKGQFEVNQEIQARPNAAEYKSSKLHLTDPNDPHLSKMEEAYMSRWSSKIPGVAHSERAYTAFLNRLRADSFDAMKTSIGRDLAPKEAEAISNFINVATGRGNLAGAAGAAISLNTAFFAPRYVLSRFELLAGQPLYRGTAATRLTVAKEYARYLGALGVIYTLSQAAGAKVEKDPHSADFGKLRFGNTRVDLLSGLSQTAVATTRFSTGKTKDASGVTKPADAAEVAGRFVRTKLAPVPGGVVDLRSGKNVVGEKVTPTDALKNMVVPMGFEDIYNAMLDQGIPKGTAFALLSIFGAGVQTYKKK